MNIRSFRFPADYLAARALWEFAGRGVHLGRSDEPQEIAKKLARDPDLFLIAEVDEQIVGTVLGGFDGRRGLVYHLAVAADYRNMGVGAALMQILEARLREKGCLRCYLLVTRDNVEAIHFYEARDWERMDLYVYAKNLE